MRRVYFDHNATTPVHPAAAAFVGDFLGRLFGNPSSLHWAGREVRPYLDEARSRVARLVCADPTEIVFTSGATEADNQAIKGVAYAFSHKGNHLITTRTEHPAVLNTFAYLESRGFVVTYLDVDRMGLVDPDDVRRAMRKETILISVMHANNETGALQPVREIGAVARSAEVLFHSDMAQDMGKIGIDVRELNVDLGAFSGHKVYAPKGVGALYVRKGIDIDNLIHGGSQEMGRRAGTENMIGVVAFGKACEAAMDEMAEETRRMEFLRGRLLEGILALVPDVHLNGDSSRRLPNTLNLSFQYVEAESLLIALDLAGIAVSAGSACSSGSTEPSHVLLAMGIDPLLCQSALRISLGRDNTEEDIDYALEVIPPAVGRLRDMSPLARRA